MGGACQSEVLGRRAGSSEELEQEERREVMGWFFQGARAGGEEGGDGVRCPEGLRPWWTQTWGALGEPGSAGGRGCERGSKPRVSAQPGTRFPTWPLV